MTNQNTEIMVQITAVHPSEKPSVVIHSPSDWDKVLEDITYFNEHGAMAIIVEYVNLINVDNNGE